MDNSIYSVTVGGLLHDIGKILYRSKSYSSSSSSHGVLGADYLEKYIADKNIIDCIRYHHKQEIIDGNLDKGNLAYIIYIADNISAGVDRRKLEEQSSYAFHKNKPLESVYNRLNNNNGKGVYSLKNYKNVVQYPETNEVVIEPYQYSSIVSDFTASIRSIDFKPEYINSLIEICEAHLSYIPSFNNTEEVSDISLFDHSKITAALAACIYLYLSNKSDFSYRIDYRELLLNDQKHFYEEKAFSILSIDISGIQDFIYTISSKGALKGLRARSFYLEILLENTVDEILEICSLSRANILYSGGGHAYILLPNTDRVKHDVENAIWNINQQLMKWFGTKLFICYGLEPCSANELMSNTDDPESYSNIFRSVSSKISAMKLHRYSPDDIRRLNSGSVDKHGRECAVCGMSGELKEYEEEIMCLMCASLAQVSRSLIENDTVFVVMNKEMYKPSLPLFVGNGDTIYMIPMPLDKAKRVLKSNKEAVVRIYRKNMYPEGLCHAAKLWMGDYAIADEEGQLKTFMELAECSEGIKRIGVLRADVDNLGTAFVKGFIRENDPNDKYKYVTISRTATLSRSLSLFFKYHINDLIKYPKYSLTGKKGERNIVIVYSGGDDMFIVGAWDEVLSAGLDIRKAFYEYTGGALTLSAGFSIFNPKYPISRMAEDTAELESKAKNYHDQYGDKNAISLFGLELDKGNWTDKHTYSWDIFENKVLDEKYGVIKKLFDCGGNYGNSFLYNILYLVRQAEVEKVNIARLAYLLARHEPNNNAGNELKTAYDKFSKNIYKWILKPVDRQQLITALIIYIYTMRDPKEENHDE